MNPFAAPKGSRIPLGQILKKKGLLTGTKLHRALDQQKLHGRKLGRILLDEGWITERDLLLALNQQMKIPIVDFSRAPKHPDAIHLISQNFAVSHLVLPFTFLSVPQGRILVVAMEDPGDKPLIQKLHLMTGFAIKPMLSGREALVQNIAEAYRLA